MDEVISPADEQPRALFFALSDDGRTPKKLRSYFDWVHWEMMSFQDTSVSKSVVGGYHVSTVFWGIVEHRDQVFETMIFEGDRRDRNSYERELAVWHCGTWEEAERQHQEALRWLDAELEEAKTWNMLP